MKRQWLILASALLLAACNGKQTAPADQNAAEATVADSLAVSSCYDELVMSEAKAQLDSTFVNTDEYAEAHTKYDVVVERHRQGMDEVEAAIEQLAMAKRAMNHYGRHFASHTEEMRDPLNQKLMATYSAKLRSAQLALVTMQLTDGQRAKVDSINGKTNVLTPQNK